MAIWFKIALVMNVIYWAVFFYLLLHRRWNLPALAVGIFHMLFAAVISVAPIRSLLDPDYVGYGVGVIHLEKRAVALPAAILLGWALTAAWLAVGKGRGRWMRLVMLGDLFFAVSMGLSIVLDGSQSWKFQLGENITIAGVPGLFVLLGFFTLPFIVCAVWAANRTRSGLTPPPRESNAQQENKSSEKDGKHMNGFRYSESRAW